MATKPILFNTQMVRAILDGQKTQTRRVVKPQPKGRLAYCSMGYKAGTWGYPGDTAYQFWGEEWRVPEGMPAVERSRHWKAPYNCDDILYVRETWNYGFVETSDAEHSNESWFEEELPGHQPKYGIALRRYWYRADDDDREIMDEIQGTWRPSIHMPKEAARIFLRVTDMRVERLQEIDGTGIKAEGTNSKHGFGATRGAFIGLWDSTIKPADLDRYGWAANPWVWVIEFERCEKPEEMGGNDE